MRGAGPRGSDPLFPRAMVAGALGGFVFVVALVGCAGMEWWLATLYLGLIGVWAVVLARARAEGGTPVVYMHPYEQTPPGDDHVH